MKKKVYCISAECEEPCKEEEIVIDGICIGCANGAIYPVQLAFREAELPEFKLEKRYDARVEWNHVTNGLNGSIDVDIFGETQEENTGYTGLEICAYMGYQGIHTSRQLNSLSWRGEYIYPYDWYQCNPDDPYEDEKKRARIKASME